MAFGIDPGFNFGGGGSPTSFTPTSVPPVRQDNQGGGGSLVKFNSFSPFNPHNPSANNINLMLYALTEATRANPGMNNAAAKSDFINNFMRQQLVPGLTRRYDQLGNLTPVRLPPSFTPESQPGFQPGFQAPGMNNNMSNLGPLLQQLFQHVFSQFGGMSGGGGFGGTGGTGGMIPNAGTRPPVQQNPLYGAPIISDPRGF